MDIRLRFPWGSSFVVLVALIVAGAWITVHAQSLSPTSVERTVRPGDAVDISKTVNTPTIPPRPDICFLADTTGSMTGAIANVRANATTIMAQVAAVQPDAQFCAGEYKDTGSVFVFRLNQNITSNTADVQTGINQWSAGGGGDFPEADLYGLSQLTATAGFRSGSSRIIVWFGDAPGHDPSNGATLGSTLTALTGASVRVLAVCVGSCASGLDNLGQATAIAGATGGNLLEAATPEQVTAAILAGLNSLPVDVSMASDCTGAITTTFVPASQTVTSGNAAVFTETIHVSLSAIQGSTYTCFDHAELNGIPMRDALGNLVLETKTIHVADVSTPSARCVEGVNAAGEKAPPAGPSAGKSGQNPDGFYQLIGTDNVAVASIVVCDSASAFCSSAFNNGDYVKITQAKGAAPSDTRPGPGVLVSHLKFTGDAILKVTDTSGNQATTQCLVPAPPK